MSESPISYVSLFLSLLALGLFVLSGFQNADDTSKSREEVSTSFVFYYDEQTGVARVRDGVAMACVGLAAADCAVDTNADARVQLKVAGALQIGGPGGPVLQTSRGGAVVDITAAGSPVPVVRVNLATGGVLVGASNDIPDTGVRIEGAPVKDASFDTEMWVATTGFDLFDEDGSRGRVHVVKHAETGRTALRLSSGGPAVSADRALHLMPEAVIIGDASANFIQSSQGSASVIVAGSTWVQTDHDTTLSQCSSCTDLPIAEIALRADLSVTYELVRLEFDACDAPHSLRNATIVNVGDNGFVGCGGRQAWYTGGEARQLGVCTRNGARAYIEYCKTSTE